MSQRTKYWMEAIAVLVVLSTLLYVSLPRFIDRQKYGPIMESEYQINYGWTWNGSEFVNELLEKEHKLTILPTFDSAKFSFQMWIDSSAGKQKTTLFLTGENSVGWSFIEDQVQATENYRQSHGGNFMTIIISTVKLLARDSWHDVAFHVQAENQTVQGFIDGKEIFTKNLPEKVSGQFILTNEGSYIKLRNIRVDSISPTSL